ncbi:Frataxin-like domain protein [Theileria parva strain Muguga]|uniref:Frataxin-like domain protein n=1 Tax=Theileria parva strain Muguga TaxID=333668 RepID=UPI001C621BFE|nr:Frataxin-like domain protein [Theileria parva strain Muguga]KAF5153111.1 Frataxin-like domain protein [Theileria parva strain Muguga]
MMLNKLRFFGTNLFKFNKLASNQLQAIYEKLEYLDEIDNLEFDGSILNIQFHNNKFILINKHEPSQKLWYSSFSGLDYFQYQDDKWISTRSGLCMFNILSNDIYKAVGVDIKFK